MTQAEVVGALAPVFDVFVGDKLSGEDWAQYGLALEDVHPADLDDAIADLRKTHAFRNAPLPAEIRARADDAKRRRVTSRFLPPPPTPITAGDGELKTITIPGIGSLTIRVLPDEHPALQRFACLDCHDSSWQAGATDRLGNPTVQRCHCWKNNPVLQLERERHARYQREKAPR